MIHFSDVLRVEQVDLHLEGETKSAALSGLFALLHGDDRVSSAPELEAAILLRDAPVLEENGVGICIAHGRTDTVRSLVMVAGRLETPITIPSLKSPLRLLFVAGIPSAFSSEYLRIVGAIARICSNAELLEKLLAVKLPAEFIALLESQLNLV